MEAAFCAPSHLFHQLTTLTQNHHLHGLRICQRPNFALGRPLSPPFTDSNEPPAANLVQKITANLPQQISKSMKTSIIAIAAYILTSSPVITNSHPLTAEDNKVAVSDSITTPLNGVPQNTSPQQLDKYSAHSAFHAHWDMHSMDSRTETLLVFANDSSSVIDLWWVDYCGCEVYYTSINPGTTHLQPSFASHPWVVREHLSQNSVLVLVATPKPIMAVVKSV